METRVVTDAAALGELETEWRRLEQKDERLPYQSTFAYVAAWVAGLAPESELLVVVARDHGELVGVLPLAVAGRSLGPLRWRELVFLFEGDRRDVVVDDSRVAAATTVKALLSAALESADAQRLNLRYLPAQSPLTAHLFRSHDHNRHLRPLVEIPKVVMSDHADFASWRRTVPRSSLTALNKLRREVGLVSREVSPVDDALFDEVAALHIQEQGFLSQQGRKGRRSLFEDPRRSAVYRSLTVGNPNASAFEARDASGRLIFYELGWRRGRQVWAWNTAYEPDLARLRPSRARIALLESMFEADDTDVYDLGAGRYPWKFELTSRFDLSYELSEWTGTDPASRLASRILR